MMDLKTNLLSVWLYTAKHTLRGLLRKGLSFLQRWDQDQTGSSFLIIRWDHWSFKLVFSLTNLFFSSRTTQWSRSPWQSGCCPPCRGLGLIRPSIRLTVHDQQHLRICWSEALVCVRYFSVLIGLKLQRLLKHSTIGPDFASQVLLHDIFAWSIFLFNLLSYQC